MRHAGHLLAIATLAIGSMASMAAGDDGSMVTDPTQTSAPQPSPVIARTGGPGVLDPEDLDNDKDLAHMSYEASAEAATSDSALSSEGVVESEDSPVTANASSPAACPTDCADGADGVTDMLDLLDVLAEWGRPSPDRCDLNASGDVGVDDVLMILAAWGTCE